MKEQISTNVYNLQKGDTVYFLQSNGDIKESIWEDSIEQQNMRNLGYAFVSEEATNNKLILRKILVSLRANEYRFTTEDWENDEVFKFSLSYNFEKNDLDIDHNFESKTDNIFFKNSEDGIIAIKNLLYNMKINIKDVIKKSFNSNSLNKIMIATESNFSDIKNKTFIKGDTVYLLNTDGTIIESEWIGNDDQKMMNDLGFVFATKEEAKFEMNTQLIEEKIKQYAYDFTYEDWCNGDITKYYLDFSYIEKEISIVDSTTVKCTRFSFKEVEDIHNLTEEIGVKDLLLYYFKVSESYVLSNLDLVKVVDHSNEDE